MNGEDSHSQPAAPRHEICDSPPSLSDWNGFLERGVIQPAHLSIPRDVQTRQNDPTATTILAVILLRVQWMYSFYAILICAASSVRTPAQELVVHPEGLRQTGRDSNLALSGAPAHVLYTTCSNGSHRHNRERFSPAPPAYSLIGGAISIDVPCEASVKFHAQSDSNILLLLLFKVLRHVNTPVEPSPLGSSSKIAHEAWRSAIA